MNKFDFSELVTTLKRGSSKNVGFQPAKPGNFDGAHDWKVVDAWLAEMEDYLHVAKVRRHSAVEFAQSYLKGYAVRGGGQWDKRKGRTMATLGSSSRNASKSNLSQGTPITSQGANFMTLWMPQMKTWGNMWGLTPNSCLRSGTCMS